MPKHIVQLQISGTIILYIYMCILRDFEMCCLRYGTERGAAIHVESFGQSSERNIALGAHESLSFLLAVIFWSRSLTGSTLSGSSYWVGG